MGPVVNTNSIILSSSKIQNRDILVPVYPVLWPLKRRQTDRQRQRQRERERERERENFKVAGVKYIDIALEFGSR